MEDNVYPMTFEEYKATVHQLYMESCLQEISPEEREQHFLENEDVVKDGYDGQCWQYKNYSQDRPKCFTLTSFSSVLWNLENLY
ncbi:MAG: hypothetical protein IJJ29_07365 [Solobacterium sp.]|nr:hypothetical protein [Solobacterium sp.]